MSFSHESSSFNQLATVFLKFSVVLQARQWSTESRARTLDALRITPRISANWDCARRVFAESSVSWTFLLHLEIQSAIPVSACRAANVTYMKGSMQVRES